MRFVDVVILANDMQNKSQPFSPINIEEHPNPIVDKVRAYYQGKHIDIKFYDSDAQDDELDGMYTRYNRENGSILFDIDIRSTLNKCWRRFVAAKELSHTLLDRDASSHTTDIRQLAQMLIDEPPRITNHEDIHSEYLALYFAIELLLPFTLNKQIMDTSLNAYQIASILSVPEKMVDIVRSDWYQKLRKESYKDLNG